MNKVMYIPRRDGNIKGFEREAGMEDQIIQKSYRNLWNILS